MDLAHDDQIRPVLAGQVVDQFRGTGLRGAFDQGGVREGGANPISGSLCKNFSGGHFKEQNFLKAVRIGAHETIEYPLGFLL